MTAITLYARATAGFDQRVANALTVLRQAATEHAGQVVQATSLGAEDMVITDLIARHQIPVAIGTLETGALHEQTVALISRIEAHYGLSVEVYRPQAEAVIHFVKTNGERAMYDSIDLRKACCGIRKLEPLSRMLDGRTAWITGLRREQSNNRGDVPFSELDDKGRTKWSPLADWSWADVWHYIATHKVPYNPLHDEFMPSIGCAPCTRAIAVGEDFRAGRWWWENEDAKECGLHKTHLDAPASSALRSEASGDLVSAQANFGMSEVKGSNEPGRSQDEKAKECGLHVHGAEEAAVSMIGDRK
ncbi:MAG: phosphoadenylyl-sulfate reductase [Rhizobacter sp.]